jgi:hypothetical protein
VLPEPTQTGPKKKKKKKKKKAPSMLIDIERKIHKYEGHEE